VLTRAPLQLERRPRFRLEGLYVGRLQALGALGNFEFNRLPFIQRFVSVRLDRGKVHEYILAGLALDESKALARVKPLHYSLFFQFSFSFR